MILEQNKKFINDTIKELSNKSGNWIDDFNKLDETERSNIINEIVMSEGRIFRHCMDKEMDIQLPLIGSFKIAPEVIYSKQKKDELIAKYGYNSFYHCPSDVKLKIKQELSEIMKESSKEYRKLKKEIKACKPTVVTSIKGLRFNNKK